MSNNIAESSSTLHDVIRKGNQYMMLNAKAEDSCNN
jgi:hypothetical protein